MVGLWRNRTMAFASAATIVLCLLILGMSYSIGKNIDYIIAQVESRFGITAYIDEGLSDQEILRLQNELERMSAVSRVQYITKDEALLSFSEANDASLFAMFKEDNPLPASFEIMVTDIKRQGELVGRISELEGIDEAIYFENETAGFINLRNTVNYICYGVIVCLIVVGILLMSNTIKLTVYIRRREINIMKYVGATDRFIRIPFVIEWVLIGFIGSIASSGALIAIYNGIYEMSLEATGVLGGLNMMSVSYIIPVLVPLYMGLGVGIGLIGSVFAIHKHLKV